MEPLLELRNINKSFGDKNVLEDIRLKIFTGDYISITGASGSGKSTLVNILAFLDNDFRGEYLFNGNTVKKDKQAEFRNRHLGFIFQQYNLIPQLTAYENAILPYSFFRGNIPDFKEKITEMFTLFGLEKQMNQVVNTLSGGEKQRVAMIRSISLDPEIIIADEPTGNLDENNSVIVRKYLKMLNKLGKTIIVVTHDLPFADEAKRKLRLSGGKLDE